MWISERETYQPVAKLNREDGTGNTKSMSTSTLVLVIPFFKELMATGHVLMSMRIFKSGKNQHCPSMPMSLTKITSTSEILK